MTNAVVIFGGTGFVGTHLASMFEKTHYYEKIILCDIETLEEKNSSFRIRLLENKNNIIFYSCDVRNEINLNLENYKIELIINCAAIHREPGHFTNENFETNLKGAENITSWADKNKCKNIIFTSSISPYGNSEQEKNEYSLTVPETAYGSSKLVAEKIHEKWQNNESKIKHLTILRPGVIYGPGEGGNVTRMIKAICKGYFVFTGNKDTKKASIYIGELCNIILFLIERKISHTGSVRLINTVSENPPKIQEYVLGIKKVLGKKIFIPSIPYFIILLISYFLTVFLSIFKLEHPFHFVRIKKLVRSNFISSKVLKELGYDYIYNLESALINWKEQNPDDWNS